MRLLISVILSALFASAAHAAATDWTGGYLGASLGYTDASDAWDQGGAPGDPKLTPEGASFGAYAGYGVDLSGLVLGIETDLVFPDLSDNAECTAIIDCTLDVQVLTSLRGRGGVALGPVQLYATSGLALGYIQADSSEPGGTSASKSLTGWTIGGGVDYQTTENLRVGFEYRHSNYGHTGVDLGTASGNVGLETDEFRLKLGLVFD